MALPRDDVRVFVHGATAIRRNNTVSRLILKPNPGAGVGATREYAHGVVTEFGDPNGAA